MVDSKVTVSIFLTYNWINFKGHQCGSMYALAHAYALTGYAKIRDGLNNDS